jgi:hypothetical protein
MMPQVVQPDIVCTNGVIHAIDTVLIPNVVAKAANLNPSKSNKEIAVSDSGVISRPPPIKPIKY